MTWDSLEEVLKVRKYHTATCAGLLRVLVTTNEGLVEKPKSPESHVDDFAAFILRILNYDSDDQDRVICQRPELSFPMAGQRVDAKSDLCVRDENDYLLLVQEDKVSF